MTRPWEEVIQMDEEFDIKDLPKEAKQVLYVVVAEMWANVDASDVHAPADFATDVIERLRKEFNV